jgi:hypothetical protein
MLFEITVPQFVKMLHNLNLIIDKAALHSGQKKFEMDVLLHARLAPDQFHFIRQVQIACDTAKNFVAKMTGQDAPAHEDTEKTLPEIKARIEKVIGYLNSFKAEDFKGAEERKITQPRWEGKYLTGLEYATQHALPNIYFHVTTAYSILRHNGVEIGKKDYLGEMPYKK